MLPGLSQTARQGDNLQKNPTPSTFCYCVRDFHLCPDTVTVSRSAITLVFIVCTGIFFVYSPEEKESANSKLSTKSEPCVHNISGAVVCLLKSFSQAHQFFLSFL
ncbi:hypothetical protein AMECASPLE_023423 [Ameca splendens]|uniref:Uncharacterized protein n=1 Tax=Ameca splendens TaxID=208324 RepID=A0ABV0XH51_9TELE